MARKCRWRQLCPEVVRSRQLLALFGGSRLYIVRQSGPAAFTLKEEGRRKLLQVRLGDPHTCSCRIYRHERELCLHICWTLLRKLNLKSEDPLSYQLGVLQNELDDLIQGTHIYSSPVLKKDVLITEFVPSKPIALHDVCPICFDELLKVRKPVTFCRYGCGQPVHIACMKILARHQGNVNICDIKENMMLTCPLCRGNFCTRQDLREEIRNAPCHYTRRILLPPPTGHRPRHEGVTCSSCLLSPVLGPLYRCLSCPCVFICDVCVAECRVFGIMDLHQDHGLAVRESPLDRWRLLPHHRGGAALLRASPPAQRCTVSEELIAELPVQRICKGQALLCRGQQCCLCLMPYQVQQEVRTLPCGHQFHSRCVSRWLLHTSDSCPLDGSAVTPTLRHRALQKACGLPSSKFGNIEKLQPYTKQNKLLQPPLQSQTIETMLRVKRLSLSDRRSCRRHQQQEKQERSIISVGISSSHHLSGRRAPLSSSGSTLSISSLSLPSDLTVVPPVRKRFLQETQTAASRCWAAACRRRNLSALESPQLTCSRLKLSARPQSKHDVRFRMSPHNFDK